MKLLSPNWAIANKNKGKGQQALLRAAISALYAGNAPAALGCLLVLKNRGNAKPATTTKPEKPKWKKCSYCGERKEDVVRTVDPYIEDIEGRVEYKNLCRDCHHERVQET